MSCNLNSSDINQTFIVEPIFVAVSTPTVTACTGVYTNVIVGCDYANQIVLNDGDTTFSTSISAPMVNSYDLQLSNRIITYENKSGASLAGKFLSGTSNGFILSDISNIKGIDTYVTGGTFSNGTSIFTNNFGGTFSVTGYASIDTYVTGGTYNNINGTSTFTNNFGNAFDVTGYFTGYTNTPIFGTGTTNVLPKFNPTNGLTNSNISDNGSAVTITTDASISNVNIGRGKDTSNLMFGFGALGTATTTNATNVAFGDYALGSTINGGNNNTALGYSSLFSNTTGAENTAIGQYTLYYNTTGTYNVGLGNGALQSNINSTQNLAIGGYSLYSLTTGNGGNVAIGISALQKATNVQANIAIGNSALYNCTTGIRNTAIGALSMYNRLNLPITGNYNVAIGFQSARAITSGSNNIIIDIELNDGVTSGNNNIILDPVNTCGISTSSNNVVIGGFNSSIPDTGNGMYFGTGNGVMRFSFDSAGTMTLTSTPLSGAPTDKLLVRTSTGLIKQIDASGITVSNAIAGSGTTGQVAFFNASNSISGSTGFTWDNTNQKLGINNNAPTYQFEVNGLLTSGADLVIRANSSAGAVGVAINNTKIGGSAGTAIAFQKNGNYTWTYGCDMGQTGTKDYYLQDVTNSTIPLFVTNTGEVRLGSPGTISSGGFWNTQKMTIKTNGNILIGTTADTAGYLLQVNGAGLFTGLKYRSASLINGIDLNGITDAGFYQGFNLTNAPLAVGTNNDWYITVEAQGVSYVHQTATSFGTNANTPNRIFSRVNRGGWSPWAEIITTANNGMTGSGTTNYIPKWGSTSGLTNSSIFDNGTNVGIGRIPTLVNLEIQGAVHSYGDIYAQRGNNMIGLTNWGNNNLNATVYSTSDIYISPNIANSFIFKTNGNFLIGTTTDNTVDKLQISGSVLSTSGYKISGGTSLQYLMADGSVSSGTTISPMVKDEFIYTSGPQTFTTSQNYSQVFSVSVQGGGQLKSDQYTLSGSNTVTITDILDSGDYIIVLYTAISGSTGTLPYYTQSQVDTSLNLKMDKQRQPKIISTNTYSLLSSDSDKILYFTSSSAITMTIPSGLTLGNSYEVFQQGTGQISFTGDGVTTIRYSSLELPMTAERYSLIGIDSIANVTEEYHIYGQLYAI